MNGLQTNEQKNAVDFLCDFPMDKRTGAPWQSEFFCQEEAGRRALWLSAREADILLLLIVSATASAGDEENTLLSRFGDFLRGFRASCPVI